MKNRYTTIAGILALVGAVVIAAGQMLNGETPNLEAIVAGITGLGLIKAGDGGL